MANPYSMNAGMYQDNPNMYQTKQSNGPSVLGTATIGAIGAGSYGAFKFRHPVTKKGEIADAFVKDVFNNNLKKNESLQRKKYCEQLDKLIKNLGKVKTPEEYKALMKKNDAVFSKLCFPGEEEKVFSALSSKNLKDNVKLQLSIIEDLKKHELQKIKNAIDLAWDSNAKKFVKTDEFKDPKLFEIIKNTKNNLQFKKALKYGGVGAAILGGLTLLYKMFVPPSQPRM